MDDSFIGEHMWDGVSQHDISCDLLIEEEDILDEDFDFTRDEASASSTPFKEPASRPVHVNAQQAMKKKKQVYVCTRGCGKTYTLEKSYREHLRMHGMREIIGRFPHDQDLVDWCHKLSPPIVENIKSNLLMIGLGAHIAAAINSIDFESDGWADFMMRLRAFAMFCIKEGSNNARLPSQIKEDVCKRLLIILGHVPNRQQVKDSLKLAVSLDTTDRVLTWLLHRIFSDLLSQMLVLVFGALRSQPVVQKKAGDHNLKERKVIHFAGGSVLKGFIRRKFQWPNEPWWQLVYHVIKEKFCCNKDDAFDEAAWTKALDRGKLTLMNKASLDFFVAVSAILLKNEKATGIMSHQSLVEVVCSSGDVLQRWDDIIGSSMSDKDSFRFMVNLCKAFCNTYSKGYIKKVKTQLMKKATASVPLRSRIAK